eukprot:1335678-Amorphochlora_amoeboformis.AAC.1
MRVPFNPSIEILPLRSIEGWILVQRGAGWERQREGISEIESVRKRGRGIDGDHESNVSLPPSRDYPLLSQTPKNLFDFVVTSGRGNGEEGRREGERRE